MAIIKLANGSPGLRTTIDGATYSHNSATFHAHRWSRGANARTVNQTLQRGELSARPQAWRALTAPQRAAWRTYAALPPQALVNSIGQTYFITGFCWYMRINNHLDSAGAAPRVLPPAGARPAAPTINLTFIQVPIGLDIDCQFVFPPNEFLGFDSPFYLRFAPSRALLWRTAGARLGLGVTDIWNTSRNFGLQCLATFGDPLIASWSFMAIQRQDSEGQRSPVATHRAEVWEK